MNKAIEEKENKKGQKSRRTFYSTTTLSEKSWREYQFERRMYIVSCVIYGLVTLFLLGLVLSRKPKVILVPPQIKEKLSISYNTAGEPYFKEMALYLTELVGNLSPATARYSIKVFSSYLDPKIYEAVRDTLMEVAETIERKQTATAFFPEKIGHIGDKWYVVGIMRKITNASGQSSISKGEEVTYEMGFKVRGFRLYVVHFKQYTGDALRKAKSEYRKKH